MVVENRGNFSQSLKFIFYSQAFLISKGLPLFPPESISYVFLHYFASLTSLDQKPFSTRAFTFTIFCSLVKMSDNPIRIISDSESDNSSTARMETFTDSNPSPFAHDRMVHRFISFTDEYASEKAIWEPL